MELGARRYKIPIKICYNDVDVDFDENVCTVDINFDQSLNDNLHFDDFHGHCLGDIHILYLGMAWELPSSSTLLQRFMTTLL